MPCSSHQRVLPAKQLRDELFRYLASHHAHGLIKARPMFKRKASLELGRVVAREMRSSKCSSTANLQPPSANGGSLKSSAATLLVEEIACGYEAHKTFVSEG
jgi:hypothetical protein